MGISDPRHHGPAKHNNCFRVTGYDETSGSVTGGTGPTAGGLAVADPRYADGAMGFHANKMRVVEYDVAMPTLTGSDRVGSGALSVADPRMSGDGRSGPMGVCAWEGNSKTIAGESFPSNGAFSVADPRPEWENRYGNLAVTDWENATKTVIGGGKGVQGGWMSVADPRTINRGKGDNYLTGGHYGVLPWSGTAGAVSASACHDNGWNSVADPRIPEADQKLIAVIRALDGTWHRPFTTLELRRCSRSSIQKSSWSLTDCLTRHGASGSGMPFRRMQVRP